jgi:DnaJ-class molecular chaperone
MRDPYEVLGVSKSAGATEIKSAFRRQAKKLHPDANKHDPKAAARFAELNAAYEILGEENKRKAFDRGEIDAEGKPRFQGFEGFTRGRGQGGFNAEDAFETFSWGRDGFQHARGRGGFGGFGGFEDVLKEAFGGASRSGRPGGFQFEREDLGRSSQDLTAALTITLAEAATGAHKRVQLPTGREIEVKIPPGLNDGQTIRLKGQGLAGAGRAGDLLITVSVALHPLFARAGADLRLEIPITLYEAVLGAKVRVPTLDGAVEVAIPAGTSSGRTFRLKGKGFPAKEGKGDLLATVRIMLPEEGDAELEELMRRWRKARPYDPRKGIG